MSDQDVFTGNLTSTPKDNLKGQSILNDYPELDDIELPAKLRPGGLEGTLDEDFPIE